MKRIISKVGLVCLIVSSLFVMVSCSTSKKAATHRADASIATKAPDYKRIKKEINSKGSEFYYPELLRRFQAADTTLSLEQVRHFYYGAATRSDYDPYNPGRERELNNALSGDTLSIEDWRKAAEIIEQQLTATPTLFRFLLYKHVVYENLYGTNSQEAIGAFFQVAMILSAITSTGDGLSEISAFYLTSTSDEYGMMEILGVSPKSQSLVEKHGQFYDVIDLEENEYGLESMYFNITVCLEALHKSFGF